MPKKAKPKKVSYELITDRALLIYGLLARLLEDHHPELHEARIALAWCTAWQRNVDGRLKLGACQKASDLDRELAAYDFVILLNRNWWYEPYTTEHQRTALLDHELCHAAVAHDKRGEPVIDERGRTVYRLRQHDVEEFEEIGDRYGTWKRDLEQFYTKLARTRERVDGVWNGYSSVRDDLVAAGVTIPIEVIATWTDAERREARTWAILRQESPTSTIYVPAVVAAAQPGPEAHP